MTLLVRIRFIFTVDTEQKRVKPQIVHAYPDLSNKEFAKEHNYVENLPWVS